MRCFKSVLVRVVGLDVSVTLCSSFRNAKIKSMPDVCPNECVVQLFIVTTGVSVGCKDSHNYP